MTDRAQALLREVLTLPPDERADAPRSGPLPSRLEQLNRIPVGIFDLDLSTARPGLHSVPEMEARFFQHVDERGEIVDPKHDAVPSAGLLPLSIRHRPRSRRLWPAEEHLRIAERHAGERGKLLVFEREAQMCRVERNGASHIFDLISDAMHGLHELENADKMPTKMPTMPLTKVVRKCLSDLKSSEP